MGAGFANPNVPSPGVETQTPPTHASAVQPVPSVHALASSGTKEQRPVAASHTSSVQGLPSSQGAPLAQVVVVSVRHHPSCRAPPSSISSSTPKRLHAPLGSWPLKIESVVLSGGSGE